MMKPWNESRRLFVNYKHQTNSIPWTSKARNPIPLDHEWIFLPFLHAFHWSFVARHRYQHKESFRHQFYHFNTQVSTCHNQQILQMLKKTTIWDGAGTATDTVQWSDIPCTH